MIIVGVSSKKLEDFCYKMNDIRPLHIVQELKCVMGNIKYAKRHKESIRNLCKKRLDLYFEAWMFFGLNMTQVNDFLWDEYMHEITDYKFL
jgi:hypothetical protein